MYRSLSICLLAASLFLRVSSIPSPDEQTLLPPSHVSNFWSWSDCGSTEDIVQIKSLQISPDPPKRGDEVTVTTSGHVSSTIQEGATANITVKLESIKLFTQGFDICNGTQGVNSTLQCPVAPGDHVIVENLTIPEEVASGNYSLDIQAFNDDEASLLCLRIYIDLV